MTSKRKLRVALATIACGVVVAPAALAAGEPKNEWPFTRPIVDRTPSMAVARTTSSVPEVRGEPKNEWPFTRPIADRTPSLAVGRTTPSVPEITGEAKNDVPFTRTVSAPAVVVQTDGRFDWADAGIGAAAALGAAFLVVGTAVLRAASGRRPRASGA